MPPPPRDWPDIIYTVLMSFRESFDVLWRYGVKKQNFSLFTSNSQHWPEKSKRKGKVLLI